jgi:hypothetical protein
MFVHPRYCFHIAAMLLTHVNVVLFIPLGLAVSAIAYSNDQVSADIDYGTFSSPAAIVRPRFRYILLDASVDKSVVRDDIQSAGSAGAGGIEFLPFYNYGAQSGGIPPGADWSTYGFGTSAFREMFHSALEAHAEAGMVMDFALGPNQGQGVLAKSDDKGLQWDLVRDFGLRAVGL